MQKINISDIEKFNRDLDLFESGKPDPDLLLKQLYPPLPVSSTSLIWGFSLVKTARELAIPGLNCVEIPEMDRVSMLILALKLENRTCRYSWDEKEKIVHFLANAGKIPPELGILLEGKTDPGLIGKYAKYLTLTQPLKLLVKQDGINLKTALEIEDLPSEVFALFLDKLVKSESSFLSFSERRQCLTWFYEFCKRERLSPEACIACFKQLLAQDNLLQAIKLLRYPSLTALEDKLALFKTNWLKGSGIELKTPENFEGAAFSVAFSFTPANFRRKLGTLKKIEEHLDELAGLL